MGNAVGKKKKSMACASSKKLVAHVKKDGFSPLPRSFSMPLHSSQPKADNYHVVALTSSTYGTLRVDVPKDLDENRVPNAQKLNPVDEAYEKLRNFDVLDACAPKPWAEVDKLVAKLRNIDTKALQPLKEEPTDDLEIINMWELMEGLDDDPLSPLPSGHQSLVTSEVNRKVRSLETSLSFDAIHTVNEVDFLRGNIEKRLVGLPLAEDASSGEGLRATRVASSGEGLRGTRVAPVKVEGGIHVSEVLTSGKSTSSLGKAGEALCNLDDITLGNCSGTAGEAKHAFQGRESVAPPTSTSTPAKTSQAVQHTTSTVPDGLLDCNLGAEVVFPGKSPHTVEKAPKGKKAPDIGSHVKAASMGNFTFKHLQGKENAQPAIVSAREGIVATPALGQRTLSLNAPSPASWVLKGAVNINSASPPRDSTLLLASSKSTSGRVTDLQTSNGTQPPSNMNSVICSTNGLSIAARVGNESTEGSAITPESLKQVKVESSVYTSPYYFSTSSDDSEDQRVPGSPLFDPELLASFEKAIDEVSEDEWYKVRRNDAEASTSGSSSDGDSPSRLEAKATKVFSSAVEDPLMNWKVESATQSKKMAFSKVAPGEFIDEKVGIDLFERFLKKCPPDGADRVVLYFTSLRGIRKTFEDCSNMKLIIKGFGVAIDERDVSMHSEFRQELKDLMQMPVPVPRLFIKGRYIGGAEEVSILHEDGTLAKLLEGLPTQLSWQQCDGCGGVRFVPCSDCSGSRKVFNEDDVMVRCKECNENGLMRCPICF